MLISEIYQSRQGEGRLTGTESLFVRTSGCNLRCEFCDTPFTSWNPEGDQLAVDQLVDRIAQFDVNHVVVTGGEPMLTREIVELTRSIHSLEKHITIETAGTVFREVECNLASISPKLSNSTPTLKRAGEWRRKHEATRQRPEIIDQFIERFEYQLKYVVASPNDLDEIRDHLDSLTTWDPASVMLMPEGVSQVELERKQEWLQPFCEAEGFIFCPRMHIQWYGNKRGT